MFDVLLRGGVVVDGTGGPSRQADVAIQGERIVEIGPLPEATAQVVLDITGKVVAPGFIDVHNHSDGWLLKTPNFTPKTLQGFTTEILMSDGLSYAPVRPQHVAEWIFYQRALNALRLDEYLGWETLEDYFDVLDRRTAQNFALQVPYANVRVNACGWQRTAPDDFQQRSMNKEFRLGLDQGAVGISTGLDYVGQHVATTDELVESCSSMAGTGGIYVTHMRYKKGNLRGVQEAVEIGRRAGVPVHLSHLKGNTPEEIDQILSYIDNTARKEVDFSFDVYPYQPGSTMLNYLLPYEVWENGPFGVAAKLQEPAIRARFAAGLEAYKLDLDQLRIAWVHGKENTQFQGQLLSEYVLNSGLPAADALINLLLEERLAVLLVFVEGDDSLVHPFLQHDLYMMGSDGIYHPGGHVHPRIWGSAPRVIGPAVRDWKLFSLESAVAKLTSVAARRFGLKDRGELRAGAFADLVVFDPQTVTDRATYEDPQQPPVGIEQVFVNGTQIVAQGQPIESMRKWPGRALRRGI